MSGNTCFFRLRYKSIYYTCLTTETRCIYLKLNGVRIAVYLIITWVRAWGVDEEVFWLCVKNFILKLEILVL